MVIKRCTTCDSGDKSVRYERHKWLRRNKPGAWHNPKEFFSKVQADAVVGNMAMQEQRGFVKTERCPDHWHVYETL